MKELHAILFANYRPQFYFRHDRRDRRSDPPEGIDGYARRQRNNQRKTDWH
jgi:hypothetical protein